MVHVQDYKVDAILIQNSLNGVKLILKEAYENHFAVFRSEITEVLGDYGSISKMAEGDQIQNSTYLV